MRRRERSGGRLSASQLWRQDRSTRPGLILWWRLFGLRGFRVRDPVGSGAGCLAASMTARMPSVPRRALGTAALGLAVCGLGIAVAMVDLGPVGQDPDAWVSEQGLWWLDVGVALTLDAGSSEQLLDSTRLAANGLPIDPSQASRLHKVRVTIADEPAGAGFMIVVTVTSPEAFR